MDPELLTQIVLAMAAGAVGLEALVRLKIAPWLGSEARCRRVIERALRRRPERIQRAVTVQAHEGRDGLSHLRVRVALKTPQVMAAMGLTSVDPGSDHAARSVLAEWGDRGPVYPMADLPPMESAVPLFTERNSVRFTVCDGEMVLDFVRSSVRLRMGFVVSCIVDVDVLEPALEGWLGQLPEALRGAPKDEVLAGESAPWPGLALRLLLQVLGSGDAARAQAEAALESPSFRVRLEGARSLSTPAADEVLRSIAGQDYWTVADEVAVDALTLSRSRMTADAYPDLVLHSGRSGRRRRRVDALRRLFAMGADAQVTEMSALILAKFTPDHDLTRRALLHLEAHAPARARVLAVKLLERGEEATLAISTLERVGDASCYGGIRGVLDKTGLTERERRLLVACFEGLQGRATPEAAGGVSLTVSVEAEGAMSLSTEHSDGDASNGEG